MISVGTWLLTVIPLIAWGLVAGLNRTITALLSHTGIQILDAGAETQEVTTRMDNQNYDDNIHANKFSTPMTIDIGALSVTPYGFPSNINITEKNSRGGFSALKNGISGMHAKQSPRTEPVNKMTEKSLNSDTEIPGSEYLSEAMVKKKSEFDSRDK